MPPFLIMLETIILDVITIETAMLASKSYTLLMVQFCQLVLLQIGTDHTNFTGYGRLTFTNFMLFRYIIIINPGTVPGRNHALGTQNHTIVATVKCSEDFLHLLCRICVRGFHPPACEHFVGMMVAVMIIVMSVLMFVIMAAAGAVFVMLVVMVFVVAIMVMMVLVLMCMAATDIVFLIFMMVVLMSTVMVMVVMVMVLVLMCMAATAIMLLVVMMMVLMRTIMLVVMVMLMIVMVLMMMSVAAASAVLVMLMVMLLHMLKHLSHHIIQLITAFNRLQDIFSIQLTQRGRNNRSFLIMLAQHLNADIHFLL